MDTAADAIITATDHGTIESFNSAAEAMFGIQADDVIGRSVTSLMPNGKLQPHRDQIARHVRTGESRIIGSAREVVRKKADGSEFPYTSA